MLDLKEEKQYDELRKLGQKLHIPIPEAFIELEVRDKYGFVIQRHKQRSHSWVRNAYNALFVQLAGKGCTETGFGAGKISIKATNESILEIAGSAINVVSGGSADDVGSGYREGAGEIEHGILVGSGINAESFEDYVLQTPIAEGTGAGELNAVQSDPHAYSYAALVGKNTLIRYFNNNSGGNVDINEVCLATKGCVGVPCTYLWVMSRDKLASTVTVPDTGQLKVTYTIQLTYPA